MPEQHIKQIYIEENSIYSMNSTSCMGNYSELQNIRMDLPDAPESFETFLKSMTIPKDEKGEYANCEVYDVDFIQVRLNDI